MEPGTHEPDFYDSVELAEHYAEHALEQVRTMQKNHSVWHPNGTPGVSLPLTDPAITSLESALREIKNMKEAHDRFRDRMDNYMHALGFLSGRLDVYGEEDDEMVKLCLEVRDELRKIAGGYWKERMKNEHD